MSRLREAELLDVLLALKRAPTESLQFRYYYPVWCREVQKGTGWSAQQLQERLRARQLTVDKRRGK